MNALKGLVFLPLDIATPEGAALAKTHRVRAYPTYLVLNAFGEVIFSWSGYGRPEGWAKTLSDAMVDAITVSEREARFAAQPTFYDALVLGKVANRENRYRDAEGYYRQAQALDPIAAGDEEVAMLIFRSIFNGVGTGEFTVEQSAANIAQLLGSQNIKPEHALEVAERLIMVKDQVGLDVIIPYLKMSRSILSKHDDPALQVRLGEVSVDFAVIIDKNPQKALRLKRELLPSGWESKSSDLNKFAWWCFQNTINLEEAEGLARKAVSLSEPGKEQANYLDTLAELVNLRGDTAGAIKLIEKALKMNPSSGYLSGQLQRFQQILAERRSSS
jgi:tetratricopeptide (TPR) repeat protein